MQQKTFFFPPYLKEPENSHKMFVIVMHVTGWMWHLQHIYDQLVKKLLLWSWRSELTQLSTSYSVFHEAVVMPTDCGEFILLENLPVPNDGPETCRRPPTCRPAVRTPWSLLTDQFVSWMPVSHPWLSALGPLHCCQEPEPWHCDPLGVVLRLSRLWLRHKGQLLWTDQLGWTVTSLCVPASLFRQHLFDFIILYYCLKPSCCFILSFLFWLLSFDLFFLFFFLLTLLCTAVCLHCLLLHFYAFLYAVWF